MSSELETGRVALESSQREKDRLEKVRDNLYPLPPDPKRVRCRICVRRCIVVVIIVALYIQEV